jgi:hypothetical protein
MNAVAPLPGNADLTDMGRPKVHNTSSIPEVSSEDPGGCHGELNVELYYNWTRYGWCQWGSRFIFLPCANYGFLISSGLGCMGGWDGSVGHSLCFPAGMTLTNVTWGEVIYPEENISHV